MSGKSPLQIIREQIKALLTEREDHVRTMDTVLAGVEQRGDGALNAAERRRFDAAKTAIKRVDEQRAELETQEYEMSEAQRARDAARDASRRYGGSDRLVPVRVTGEPSTYVRGGQHSFLNDMMRRSTDPDAAERVGRSQREAAARLGGEHRAVTTGSFGALVVPQFLDDMFAEVVRAGRPLLNSVDSRPLPPEGMVLNIPRGTTGTIVGSQSGENTSVTSQDFDETTLQIPVRTIAGQQDISRQSLDRGRDTDEIILRDLSSAYATELNRQAINGTGLNGEHLGILSVTAIDTVAFSLSAGGSTAARAHSMLADAVQRVNSTRFLPPTVIYMHPRRWGWFTASVDSQGRPLVVPNSQAPQNAIGVGEAARYGQLVGTILGLPVISDAGVPTSVSSSTVSGSTEDVIIVSHAPDLHVWESGPGPMMVEFRETLAGALTVKLVAWDYTAFSAERFPTATVIVSGSSLTTPTF